MIRIVDFQFLSSWWVSTLLAHGDLGNCWNCAVKAPNIQPHGNFPYFLLTRSVAPSGEFSHKNEYNQFCRSKWFIKLLFSLLFCKTRSDVSKVVWIKSGKFPWGGKLGAFTVNSNLCTNFSFWKVRVAIWLSCLNTWNYSLSYLYIA